MAGVPGARLVAPLVGRIGERSGSKAPFLAGCRVVAGALLGLALAHNSVGLVILWSCLISAAGAIVAALSVLLIPGRSRESAAEMRPQAAVS